MKIELKYIHFNNVLLSIASIIFRFLSVAFTMLTVYIVNTCTVFDENRDFYWTLTKKCYFFKKFLLVQLYKWSVFHDISRRLLVCISVIFKGFTYVNVYIVCTYICSWKKVYLQCSFTKFTYQLITLYFH